MSVRLVELDTPGRNDGHRRLAARLVAGTISVIAGLAQRIVAEVVYTLREDLRHGQIERDPKSWERD